MLPGAGRARIIVVIVKLLRLVDLNIPCHFLVRVGSILLPSLDHIQIIVGQTRGFPRIRGTFRSRFSAQIFEIF